MDIDLFKSINSEDQMEMMVMMHMNEMPIMEFSPQGINNTTNNLPQIIHDHNSSTFLNIPSTNISFTNSSTLVHDQESSITLPFLENSTSTIRDYKEQVSLTSHLTFPSTTMKRNNSMGAMREMIFKIAAMQPIHIDPESIKPPKRKNVKISNDPQSIAARHRRERISEKMRVLQRLVPGGTKMDTASMLDEAIHYMKFLKKQVQNLEKARPVASAGCLGFPVPMSLSGNNYNLPMGTRTYHQPYHQCIQP